MMENSASTRELEAAIRFQERFEFYIVALTFTVLGFSVQSASLGVSVVADSFEVLSWGLLLTAGLIGLFRLERTPNLRRLYSLSLEQDEKIRAAAQFSLATPGARLHVGPTGEVISPTDYLRGAEEGKQKVEAAISPETRRLVLAYEVMRLAFSAGFVALLVSRSCVAVAHMFGYVLR
jgi:hypothetical protein